MAQPTHIIDPDGEVMIILRNANAPFAPDGSVPDKPIAVTVEKNGGESEVRPPSDDATGAQSNDSDKESTKPQFCIQVSAKHLTTASPVFKRLLTGSWKESVTLLQKGSVEITAESWDIEAFLILLRIMHCQFNQIPRKLTVEMLAKVAVLADYYECKEMIGFFVNNWADPSEGKYPTTYCRDLILWLWIGWAFRSESFLSMITSTAMSHSTGEISSLGLPIPDRVIESMIRRREEAMEKIVNFLHTRHEALLDGKLGCKFECSSIMYGALTKQMKSKALLSPRPSAPFLGLTYSQLVQKIRSFKSPEWSLNSYNRHSCNDSSFEDLLGKMHDSINGLALKEFDSK